MNKEQFIASGQAAFGAHFVTEIAKRLNVSDRTVRHWVSGKYSIPATLLPEFIAILIERKTAIENAITELRQQ
jgi:DNA-binding transcriptional regulator YdaS (Cro superfamily)